MANIYSEWSLEDDLLLFNNRRKPLPELASMLGRGLQGVNSRLAKLNDVSSPTYNRLFANGVTDDEEESGKAGKLVPVKEVLRRIKWDGTLLEKDFSVLYYDRVEDEVLESKMDEENNSIESQESLFAYAIPEHRIEGVKYKERVVWDKEERIDRVFGSMMGQGETIDQVVFGYDEWKQRKDAAEKWNRERQRNVTNRIQQILGDEKFNVLKQLSNNLQEQHKEQSENTRRDATAYVEATLKIFQEIRLDPTNSSEPASIPQTDRDALESISELVALLPDSTLRPIILQEISNTIERMDGKKVSKMEVVELNEDDLAETFVRGSGAGGQKVNKTSNRVVLLHKPTQLRVECQDTRSLQQNRKIARKRLRLKLDELINGKESKISTQARKKSEKKAKAKARNKSRQKKKKEGNRE
eukprot:CAMPEP_0178937986 /NCGR_PEP_ID=MMETSP0786-20121207/26078_1 /TAXON_ID=186022 /ORGANISM="Thalassionema frauenfeldii, Strain CCMP 1798" /LENGTH=413 /DNA_ID=CAMNT_0020616651 /DNA_START=239 /DNA_END=1480 /DNA_ORIENTATION=+